MSVKILANYAIHPTSTEPGILGVKILADSPITRPIHIALVLDTSGSMDGDRIVSVKNTLCCLIDKLSIGDKISIVGFSSKATVIASKVTITDVASKTALKASVIRLIADGGTNMEAGVEMLGSIYTDGIMPDSLVVLTDGFVNEGIATVTGMYSLLKSYMPFVPVYALGYGDEHNADFMRGLSKRTAGTYSFIDNEIALPASIGELLGALQGEVAKSATFEFPATWTCLELNYTQGDTSYDVGSLIADKPTWAIFSVPPTGGNILLKYRLIDNSNVNITTKEVLITPELERIDIIEQELRCLSALALDNASSLLKQNDIDKAKNIITNTIHKISCSEAAMRPLAIRIKAQLEEMNEDIKKILSTPPRLRRNALDLTNLALRTSSTATRYTQQRGASSRGYTNDDIFSSPVSIQRQSQMVAEYSQNPGDPIDMT
jgi:hypothetical protein